MKLSLRNKKLMGLLLSFAAFSSAQADIIGVQAEDGTFDSADWEIVTQATINGANAPLNTEILGGGSAIMAIGVDNFVVDAARSADFSLTIATAGNYGLWVRYIIPNFQTFADDTDNTDNNNSFHYTAFNADSNDDGSFSSALNSAGLTPDEAFYVKVGATQALTIGANTFSVAPRENGFVIDGFVITNEAFNETSFDSALSVVPEPSAYALLAGLIGMASVMVRRRRS